MAQDPTMQQDPNAQGQPPQEEPTFTEPGKDNEQPVQNLEAPQEEQPLQQKQQMGQDQKSELERPFEQIDEVDDLINQRLKKSLECNACPKSVNQYEGWIARKLNVLGKRRLGEGVGLLFGLPTIEQQGKKIKGVLAYAGVSLNNRIYLPEELAKGDGLTLPLLLNHSNVAGAEEELDRLDNKMRGALENQEDYVIGEVTLRWEPDELTLYYEGVINDSFFQKEVDDANMAVSLGIWYDSDSPQVCDEECYTMIRGAEFREVSLVYHPGFPIATIEAVEAVIKKRARKQIADEANWRNNIQFNSNGTADLDTITANVTFTGSNDITTAFTTQPFRITANEQLRHYPLQPKMSIPKTTGELKIPNNPEIKKPEDTMKAKKKTGEKKKKSGTKKRVKK